MARKLQRLSLGEGRVDRAPLVGGLGWGVLGGLAGTVVMDLLLMGVFLAVGQSAFLCFSIVGDTAAHFFSMFGIRIAGGVAAGMAAHYSIGPIVGAIFGSTAAAFPALREGAWKKTAIAAVVYVEILSQPVLATTPILLKMSPPEIVQWYGGSFAMHLVFGIVLGAIVGNGARTLPPLAFIKSGYRS